MSPRPAPAQLLERAWIAARLPHAGRMCLLDAVLEWSPAHVLCRADNHRAPDHPLRQFGRLGAACGVEYAAQAIAVHAALLAGDAGADDAPAQPRSGMLVGARRLTLHVERLDDVDSPLLVRAEPVALGEDMLLYDFTVRADTRMLLEGRAAILLGPLPEPAQEPRA